MLLSKEKVLKYTKDNLTTRTKLSDRLDHLDYMLNKIKELDIGTSDKYIGGMKH